MANKSDQQLALEVHRAIGMLPEVNRNDFSVSVLNGVARIVGTTPLLAHKRAVVEAAMAVEGIVAVDDASAVITPRPPRDVDLAEDIDAALDEDEEVDARHVGATVAQGQAMMHGSVRSVGELSSAIDTTTRVPNTVNVIDSTRIENPYGADPIDLANAVALAFMEHPVLHNRAIRPRLEGTGKIVLTGQVRSEEERREALSVASRIPGAHSVREELRIAR